MATIEYRIKPQGPVLAEYMRCQARVQMIMGPLGSGKTVASGIKIFRWMCQQAPNKKGIRPSRWYAIRNTYPDLTTTTIKDWLALFGDLGKFTGGGMEPPTHRLEFDLPDGTTVEAEIVFIALDRDDAVKKLRGAQVTGFWLNEVKELAKSIVDMADLRHGRYPSMAMAGVDPSWHGMIGDTNAPDDTHWYYHLAEVEKPKGWVFFRQPGGVIWDPVNEVWRPNPSAENLSNLPAGYYEHGCAGKDHDWIRVNLANEYGSVVSGAVYGREMAAIEAAGRLTDVPYDPSKLVDTWWDLGWGDCTSVILFQRIGIEDRIIDFVQDRQRPIADYIAELQRKPYVYGVDHLPHDAFQAQLAAGGRTIASQFEELGRRVVRVPNVPLKDGIDAARRMLQRVWIDRQRCGDLIAALKRYRYDISRDGVWSKNPKHDENSHAADAFRYLAVTQDAEASASEIVPPEYQSYAAANAGSWMM